MTRMIMTPLVILMKSMINDTSGYLDDEDDDEDDLIKPAPVPASMPASEAVIAKLKQQCINTIKIKLAAIPASL